MCVALFQTVKPSPKSQIVPIQPIEMEVVKIDVAPKPEESPVYSKITPPKIKPFNINLKDTDGKRYSGIYVKDG